MLEHKPYAKKFYASKEWKKVREYKLKSVYGLCERCMAPAKIVHHIEYISMDNINDPNITLNVDNLEALCQDCHNKEHHANDMNTREGLRFDSKGFVVEE